MDTLTQHLWEDDLLTTAKDFIFWLIWLYHHVWSGKKSQYRASLCPIPTHTRRNLGPKHTLFWLSQPHDFMCSKTQTLHFFVGFSLILSGQTYPLSFGHPWALVDPFSTPNEPKSLPIVSIVFFYPTAHLALSHQLNSPLFLICMWIPCGNHVKWPHSQLSWWNFA